MVATVLDVGVDRVRLLERDTAVVPREVDLNGYRSAPAPTTAAAQAYRAAILLRELRGGVHTDAVKACGLSPATACQFNRDLDNFKMRSFSDDDIVEHTPKIEAQKAAAKAATTAQMAALFAPLSQTQLDAIVTGTNALVAALG